MSTRSTVSLSKPLTALLAALALGTAALPALADQAPPTSRQQVREELRMWKATNMFSQSGEISETPAVLDARDAFYSLQTDVMREENRVAMQQQSHLMSGQAEQRTPVVVVTDAE